MRIVAILLLVIGLASCQLFQKEVQLQLESAEYHQLEGWEEADVSAALAAFRKSCDHWRDHWQQIPTREHSPQVQRTDWQHACVQAEVTVEEDARTFFETFFKPYRVFTNYWKSEALLTGYYEPVLAGSRTQAIGYDVPVWGVPDDLVSGDTYPMTRKEIDEQGLHGKAEILLWVKDPVELFFLHIQGSGRVKLTDGTIVGLQYAAKNNQPYRSIGKLLIDREKIGAELMSMQALKSWLNDHPKEAQEVMWYNDSYVFFTLVEKTEGPVGAQNVALTPEGSMAVDPAYIPYGWPLWVDTTRPRMLGPEPALVERAHPQPLVEPLRRLLVAQDTGSAIKGPLRGDIFFGHGGNAGLMAGLMKQPGYFTVLLPYIPTEK